MKTFNKKIVPNEFEAEVIRMKAGKKGHIQYILDTLECPRVTAKQIARAILEGHPLPADLACYDTVVNDQPQQMELIEDHGKYVYNQADDTYAVPLQSTGGTVVIPGFKHEGMLRAYTNWDGASDGIDEICRKFGFSRPAFLEYKKIMGWLKTSAPVTPEQLAIKTDETLIGELTGSREHNIMQKVQRLGWAKQRKDAESWSRYKGQLYDPLQALLETYKPEPFVPRPYTRPQGKRESDHVMLIGLSDLHFGNKAESARIFGKAENHDIKRTKDLVTRYAEDIRQTVADRNYTVRTGVVCVVGDILHTLSGFTKKGTQLDFSAIGTEQLLEALDSMIQFVNEMLTIFERVEVKVVEGNHSGIDEFALFKIVEAHFRLDDRITFEISRCRTMDFTVLNTYCIMDHGDSAYFKAKVPSDGAKREAYIQSLILRNPDKWRDTTNKIFLQGDMHHFESRQFNDFQFFMLGTISPADQYSADMGFHTRPQQHCLMIDSIGVSEICHYYFD